MPVIHIQQVFFPTCNFQAITMNLSHFDESAQNEVKIISEQTVADRYLFNYFCDGQKLL